MRFPTVLNTATKSKLLQLLRAVGVLLVVAVNAFVFLSDTNTTGSSAFRDIVLFVDHAGEEHKVNETPFTLTLNFSGAAVSVMDSIPAFPLSLPQFLPALIGQLLFGFMSIAISFYLFKGEENKNSQFSLTVIIPPPRFF